MSLPRFPMETSAHLQVSVSQIAAPIEGVIHNETKYSPHGFLLLSDMEKKAPFALPVSHYVGEEMFRHRPTQGWTVDEASLLCKVIYIL